MAHIQLDTADPMLATHYRFQIRTFWIGLLYLVVGTVLSLIIIGWAVLRLVVYLVADTQHQGCARAQRAPADCRSWLMVVRMTP